ncbi:MAG: hypothetical protein SFV55_04920 [Haliscomenobacter sp.]|uniref:hypothetical protein n=1 Tax=Haliscomenobacter sp. TaxID=2717303 RepID=UPI0029B0DF0E|nr:hypothetical protein [Haliscomenobacter sp.]MDX2067745.1 hypothetical protein [Haliscomenobacter sp.]
MIVILGTGQVGRALLDQLQMAKPGSNILLVNRQGKVDFDLPSGTNILGLDATVPEHLIDLFRKAEIVFSCTDVPYQFWGKFYPLLSHAMVEGLKHSEAKLVFADNLYSYGNLKGALIHEGLEHLAQTQKGKIRTALINDFATNGVSNRVAIVKASDFIGPRIEKGLFGVDFLNSIHHHKTVYLPGKVQLPHHFTFIEDFAKAMLAVAFDAEAYHQIWHVPNASAISQSAWIDLFSQYTGLKIKYRSIPAIALRLAGVFNPFVAELNELSYQFQYPYLVGSQKFVERFGDISTPPDVIVQKTVEWFYLKNSVNANE